MIRKIRKYTNSLILISVSMMVLLFLLLYYVDTFAETETMLSASSGCGYRNEKVIIRISLDNSKDIEGIQFTVKYNSSALSISQADISKGTALQDWIFDKNVLSSKGEIKIACAGSSKLQQVNPINICNMVFTIKIDADYGEIPVSLESVYAGNGSGKLQVISCNGAISVLDKPAGYVPTTSPVVPQTTSAVAGSTNPTTSPAVAKPTNPANTPAVTALPTHAIIPSANPAETLDRPITSFPSSVKYMDLEGHWAAQSILDLLNTGIVSGYPDGSIKPDSKITRAEMITILIKALAVDTGNSTQTDFSDKKIIPGWAQKYIGYAVKNSLVKGYEDNTFRPNRYINRSEMAVLIIKAFSLETDKEKTLNFSDAKIIPAWAKEFISAAFQHKIINGYVDNSIRPLNDITRAEAFVILERALEARAL